MKLPPSLISWLQVGPLTLVLLLFFGAPMIVVLIVSFFDYQQVSIIPTFILDNYQEVFTSNLTLELYLSTLRFAVVVWAVTLVIGFALANFLVFHIRSLIVKLGLFALVSIPFWTSNIIRMIAWIPFLGRDGLVNSTLLDAHLIPHPLTFLLFSRFAVDVSYVHLFTLFMVVPIFNSMVRIDPALIEAARDAGASRWKILREIVIPLSKSGMALGTIFVITQVMGDFFVVQVMSGGQSASVVSALQQEISAMQYPPAAASAVVLVVVVLLMVAAVLRVVDVRKELAA
ncbi:MAG TPA: ABC transporter permease [Stellaceae bacterium]|nr:ABC transporter permease [Stellaceae bacterium]